MMGAQVLKAVISRDSKGQAPEHIGCMCSEYVGGLSIAWVGVDKESEKKPHDAFYPFRSIYEEQL